MGRQLDRSGEGRDLFVLSTEDGSLGTHKRLGLNSEKPGRLMWLAAAANLGLTA